MNDDTISQPLALITSWRESLTSEQTRELSKFPSVDIARLAATYRASRVKKPSWNVSVGAVLYHYFKVSKLPMDLVYSVGTQASLAYYFNVDKSVLARHWSALEVWLCPV